jgi:hypothetical protein
MSMRSSALTIVAEIDPGQRADLDKRLAIIAEDLDGSDGENTVFPLRGLPRTHFIRWLILPDRERELPPMLMMESNHDGPTEPYLRDLAAHAPDGLDALFGCCLGYPARGARDVAAFVAWMTRHSIPAAAFYCAYRDVPKAQVDNDGEVHAAIRRLIDGDPAQFRGETPRRALEKIRAAMRRTSYDISPQPDDKPRFDREARRTLIATAAGVLVSLPVLLPALPGLLFTLRWKETHDKPKVFPHPVQDRGHHRRDEDFIVQNQLSNVVDVKPGVFRYLLLRTVLFAIDRLARVYFVNGHLGGITSIHFARWVIVKDPRPWRLLQRRRHRLVFFSNYDASWESYLGEFVDRAAGGLTAVWGNTEGFPRARWLKEDGADDEEAFKNWARDIQIPTQVWWSGVPRSTTQNVRDDIWIRRRLERELTDEEIVEWLRRL